MDVAKHGFLWTLGAALFSLLFGLLGLGCNAQAALDNGTLRMSYQPAIIWRVDTGLWFNGAEKPLVELNGEVTGSAETEDVEPAPD